MLITLLAMCIGLDVLREVLFKTGTLQLSDGPVQRLPAISRDHILRYRWFIVGVLVWGVEILLWAQALVRLPLNVAAPIMALTYALTPLAGLALFHERISRNRWIGIATVTAGAMLVGTTGMQ